MEESKSLEDKLIDLYPTLESFKVEFKSLYYGYFVHKYPDSTYLEYLDILITLYSRANSENKKYIKENKDSIPEWVIERKEEEFWLKCLEFDKNLTIEYDRILEFIYDEYDIENGKLIEQERFFTKTVKITDSIEEDVDEKTQNKYSVPEKIKILEILNVKGWLMDKHSFTIFQIEELLSDLFDRTDRTIRASFSNSNHENTAKKYLEELKKIKAKRQ